MSIKKAEMMSETSKPKLEGTTDRNCTLCKFSIRGVDQMGTPWCVCGKKPLSMRGKIWLEYEPELLLCAKFEPKNPA